jgi:hypothetical protein
VPELRLNPRFILLAFQQQPDNCRRLPFGSDVGGASMSFLSRCLLAASARSSFSARAPRSRAAAGRITGLWMRQKHCRRHRPPILSIAIGQAVVAPQRRLLERTGCRSMIIRHSLSVSLIAASLVVGGVLSASATELPTPSSRKVVTVAAPVKKPARERSIKISSAQSPPSSGCGLGCYMPLILSTGY